MSGAQAAAGLPACWRGVPGILYLQWGGRVLTEEMLQEAKTREEHPLKGRVARGPARDKEPPAAEAASKKSGAEAISQAQGTAVHKPEAGKSQQARSEAKKAGDEASGLPLGGVESRPGETEAASKRPETGKKKENRPGRTPEGLEKESQADPVAELRHAASVLPREVRELREIREGRDAREERPEKRETTKEEKDELLKALKMLAPGTSLREGLESILRAKMGALIILGDTPEILDLVDGGFRIDTEFTPSNIYELAKMDGAIILSQDAQRILYANTQLIPDPTILSDETGIRHRTAQRFGVQTGAVVIAISHRRGVITLYKGPMRYILWEIEVILSKANQAIQTLERYKRVLDKALVNLTALEFEELVTVLDVAKVVQRAEMVLRIGRELEGYIAELGLEGRLVTMQAEELAANVEEELLYVIQDYHVGSGLVADVKQYLANCSPEELLELSSLSRALGYGATAGTLDLAVFPRGYRILHKIPKLPALIIEFLVQNFARLQSIVKASIEELDAVEGIGDARAWAIKNGMRRIQEQVMLDRYM